MTTASSVTEMPVIFVVKTLERRITNRSRKRENETLDCIRQVLTVGEQLQKQARSRSDSKSS